MRDLTFLPPSSYKPFSCKNRVLKPLKKTPGWRAVTSEEVLKDWRWTIRCQSDSGVSWSGEAEIDLHRQAAADDQPKTGRVHTSYHQAVTATGRLW
ncbi:hypothetical protein ACLK17_24125 [Escherichia coli]